MLPPLTGQASAKLADDLERGFSLPAAWYTDPAIGVVERDRIFRRAWQYVGRTDQLANVGDYITGSAGDLPVVVVRGEQGLQAFLNVCRHRRHLVVSGVGNRKVLQCPYHAWSYDLDGCLRAAPRADREQGFRLEDYPLLRVQVNTWGPFVFVNADAGALPLAHYLGEMPQLMNRNGLDLAQLRFHERTEWRTAANWKVMIENYLECYHCPVAHPGFSSVVDVDPDAYALEPFEWFSVQHAPVLASAVGEAGKRPAYDARGPGVRAQYYFLWPNFSLNINPGHPNLLIHGWVPEGPDHTRGFTEQFFGPDTPAEFQEQLLAFSHQVGTEDEALTVSVQRGLQAGLPEQARLLPRSERLIVHFQKLVLRALTHER